MRLMRIATAVVMAATVFLSAGRSWADIYRLAEGCKNVDGGNWKVFLIGVGKHDDSKIRDIESPPKDVDGLFDVFLGVGVPKGNIVRLSSNCSGNMAPVKENIEREYARFVEGLREGDVAFVYYSGDGWGINKDSEPKLVVQDSELRDGAVDGCLSVNEMLKQLDGSKAARKLFVIDACYPGWKSAEDVSVPESTTLALSCQPDENAFELPMEDGTRSLYTEALRKTLFNMAKVDADKDGKATFEEFRLYLNKTFLALRDAQKFELVKRQTPGFWGDLSDFVLFEGIQHDDESENRGETRDTDGNGSNEPDLRDFFMNRLLNRN